MFDRRRSHEHHRQTVPIRRTEREQQHHVQEIRVDEWGG